jgi:hypothetical protein
MVVSFRSLTELNKFKTPRKGAATKSSFSINDYRDTAESVGKTVNEMRDLTAEVRKLLESEQLSEYTFMPRRITNLMAWRLGQLISLIFILAVIYRVVIVRYVNKPKQLVVK